MSKVGRDYYTSVSPRSKNTERLFHQLRRSQQIDGCGDALERQFLEVIHPVLPQPQTGSGDRVNVGYEPHRQTDRQI